MALKVVDGVSPPPPPPLQIATGALIGLYSYVPYSLFAANHNLHSKERAKLDKC